MATPEALRYGRSMTHPAEEARGHIMAALAACQEDPALGRSLELLARDLAQAQGKLFQAARLPAAAIESMELMRRAMEHLAQALKTLQDVRTGSPAIGVAAASIAKALKTLHPAVREVRRISKVSLAPPAEARRPEAPGGEPASVNVNTMLSASTDHQFWTGFSENIEEGGIFVATFEPEPVGTPVVVNFRLPGNRPVTARGTVQWMRDYNPLTPETPPGMGVRFTDLLPDDKRAIESFMKTREPMFYEP